MRLTIDKDHEVPGTFRILCGEEAAGFLAWDGRGAFSLEAFERTWMMRRPDALARAQRLGSGARELLVKGASCGCLSTRREKDGLLGSCGFYEFSMGDGAVVRGYPNPGGGRGWRMSVYHDGEQIALVKRASEPVHTPDGFTVVAPDEDAATAALLLVAYDVYTSYLENDGGAAGPFGFRFVNIFGKRAAQLDDPSFEARCEGELPDEDDAVVAPPENATDRAARLAQGFSVKGEVERLGHNR